MIAAGRRRRVCDTIYIKTRDKGRQEIGNIGEIKQYCKENGIKLDGADLWGPPYTKEPEDGDCLCCVPVETLKLLLGEIVYLHCFEGVTIDIF